jgi:nucleoside-diphosphate-sugar epimerase
MRTLVSGAGGFIGSYGAAAFAAEGHAVTGLEVLAPPVPAAEPGADDAAAPSDQAASGSGDLIRADVRDARTRTRWRRRCGASGFPPSLPGARGPASPSLLAALTTQVRAT